MYIRKNTRGTLRIGSIIMNLVNNRHDGDLQHTGKSIKLKLDKLAEYTIIPPFGYFTINENMRIVYLESIFCYILGMPNSCMPAIVRVLERALRKKYEMIEKKSSRKMSLECLIDWSKKFYDNTGDTRYFKRLRNHIHNDILVEEKDCLAAIQHTSKLINKLYNIRGKIYTNCPKCRSGIILKNSFSVHIGEFFDLKCNKCSNEFEIAGMIGFDVDFQMD